MLTTFLIISPSGHTLLWLMLKLFVTFKLGEGSLIQLKPRKKFGRGNSQMILIYHLKHFTVRTYDLVNPCITYISYFTLIMGSNPQITYVTSLTLLWAHLQMLKCRSLPQKIISKENGMLGWDVNFRESKDKFIFCINSQKDNDLPGEGWMYQIRRFTSVCYHQAIKKINLRTSLDPK